jgi:hypothetical protein
MHGYHENFHSPHSVRWTVHIQKVGEDCFNAECRVRFLSEVRGLNFEVITELMKSSKLLLSRRHLHIISVLS